MEHLLSETAYNHTRHLCSRSISGGYSELPERLVPNLYRPTGAGEESGIVTFERTEDIERGLRLIPTLGEVMPEQAEAGVHEVYQSVQARLRVPIVNFIFRVLANHPDYLRFAWGTIEPNLLTTRFERAADDLRARALLEPIPDPPGADWQALGDLGTIRNFTDTIHYVLPKLLLIVSAFDEGLAGQPGNREGALPDTTIAPGMAEGTAGLSMITEEETGEELNRLFQEIRERHGHPAVASYYRAIGRWPRFLKAIWEAVQPFVGSPAHGQRKDELLEEARNVALRLSLPEQEELGLDDESLEELRAILAMFRFRVIPDTFLEVAVIKAMLDGPEAARISRFSFAVG